MEFEECAVFINQQITRAGCKFSDFFVTIGFSLSKVLPQDLDFSPQCVTKNTIAVVLRQKFEKKNLAKFCRAKEGEQ